MNWKKYIVSIVIILFVSGSVQAWVGKDVLIYCKKSAEIGIEAITDPKDALDASHCFGFIAGVSEGLKLGVITIEGIRVLEVGGSQNDIAVSISRNDVKYLAILGICESTLSKVSTSQFIKMFYEYVKSHPEEVNIPASILYLETLKALFPLKNCTK